jgi:hypothetical protein
VEIIGGGLMIVTSAGVCMLVARVVISQLFRVTHMERHAAAKRP